MLQTFLIGLREGLEAALIVSILLTFLTRTGQRGSRGALWAGVCVAVLGSLAFGAVLQFTSANLSSQAQETFGGLMSLTAVGFVTWMVFWMRREAGLLKGMLNGKMIVAAPLGKIAVALTAVVAVGREGLETALFLYPTFQAQGSGLSPALGAVMGLVVAVIVAAGLYRGVLALNLHAFFKATGVGLIVIAAGVAAYGVHELQEVGVLPGVGVFAWDVVGYQPTSWYGSLLGGVFGFSPQMTVLQVVVYVAYISVVLALFLKPATNSSQPDITTLQRVSLLSKHTGPS